MVGSWQEDKEVTHRRWEEIKARIDKALFEKEYEEWSRVFDEQENLLTEEEYDLLLKQQAYEDEREYVRTAGYPI